MPLVGKAATSSSPRSNARKRFRTYRRALLPGKHDLLRHLNAQDFSRVADSVPGVAFATTGPGNSQYIIRGIGGVGFVQSPTTGVCISMKPRSRRGRCAAFVQPDPQLFDVARVEVLRGPQGVLFGSSNMGGLVRIITNQPDESKVAATGQASVAGVTDGGTSWNTKAMLNLPIVADTLALRVSGGIDRQGGWIDDLRPTTGDLTENAGTSAVHKDVNWTRTSTIRGALRWNATPTLTITPSFVWQDGYGNADRPHSDVTFGKRARLKTRYADTFRERRVHHRFAAGGKPVRRAGRVHPLRRTPPTSTGATVCGSTSPR